MCENPDRPPATIGLGGMPAFGGRFRRPGAVAWRYVLACLCFVACAHVQVPPNTEEVRSIAFRGNGGLMSGTSDFNLRSAMEQEDDRLLAWLFPARRRYLSLRTLRLDAWRIENWYAHHGYFDARFEGWEIRHVQGRFLGRRRRVVKVVGYVDPGAAYQVRSVTWPGLDRPEFSAVEADLRDQSPVRPLARFRMDDVRDGEEMTISRLHEASHPRAKVTTVVEVHPEDKSIDVAYQVDPGRACVFGKVRIVGHPTVARKLIEDEIPILPGQPYRASRLVLAQRQLYGLGLFRVVNVVPELDQSQGPVVPIRIDLEQGKARQIRLGGGVATQNGKSDIHATANFQHVNLFNRLIRLEADNEGGYAWVGYGALGGVESLGSNSATSGTPTRGPTGLSKLTLQTPRFPGPKWQMEDTVSVRLGVEEGYKPFQLEVSPALLWQPEERLSLRLSYHLQDCKDCDLENQLAQSQLDALDLKSPNPYLQSYLSQQFVIDTRDDVIFTHRGLFGTYTISEAGGPVRGDFDYVKVTGDQRGYLPLRPFLRGFVTGAVAGRLAGGIVFPYGSAEKATVPLLDRLYLGGTNTVRGWTRNHLGPYACAKESGNDCVMQPGVPEPTDQIIPVGGRVSMMGSAEARIYDVRTDFGIAVFSDVGMVYLHPAEIDLSRLAPTVGAGLRYQSAIGPVRLDFGVRLDHLPEFQQEKRYAFSFSIGEAY